MLGMMKLKRLTPLVVACVMMAGGVMFAPATAQADLDLSYYMDSAILNYDNTTMELTIGRGDGSVFELLLNDTDTFTVVDSSLLSTGGGLELLVDLDLVRNGANDYSATGTFEVVDASHTTAILADFASTQVSILNGELEIRGNLTGQGPPDSTILVNKGNDPWVFEGDAEQADLLQGTDLSVYGADHYTQGLLTTVSFGLGGVTLDGFFDAGVPRELIGGTLQGQIQAPLPSALLLGAMGLVLAVWLRRRF